MTKNKPTFHWMLIAFGIGGIVLAGTQNYILEDHECPRAHDHEPTDLIEHQHILQYWDRVPIYDISDVNHTPMTIGLFLIVAGAVLYVYHKQKEWMH